MLLAIHVFMNGLNRQIDLSWALGIFMLIRCLWSRYGLGVGFQCGWTDDEWTCSEWEWKKGAGEDTYLAEWDNMGLLRRVHLTCGGQEKSTNLVKTLVLVSFLTGTLQVANITSPATRLSFVVETDLISHFCPSLFPFLSQSPALLIYAFFFRGCS